MAKSVLNSHGTKAIRKLSTLQDGNYSVAFIGDSLKTTSPFQAFVFDSAVIEVYNLLFRRVNYSEVDMFSISIAHMDVHIQETAQDNSYVEFVIVYVPIGRAFKFRAEATTDYKTNYKITLIGSHASKKYDGVTPNAQVGYNGLNSRLSDATQALQVATTYEDFKPHIQKVAQNFNASKERLTLVQDARDKGRTLEEHLFKRLFSKTFNKEGLKSVIPVIGGVNILDSDLYTYKKEQLSSTTRVTCVELGLTVHLSGADNKIVGIIWVSDRLLEGDLTPVKSDVTLQEVFYSNLGKVLSREAVDVAALNSYSSKPDNLLKEFVHKFAHQSRLHHSSTLSVAFESELLEALVQDENRKFTVVEDGVYVSSHPNLNIHLKFQVVQNDDDTSTIYCVGAKKIA